MIQLALDTNQMRLRINMPNFFVATSDFFVNAR
jgi:hypothetical protein